MNLQDFPNAIAQAQLQHLTALQQVRHAAGAVEARKAEFAAMVVADASLTNEAKRKDARAQLELTDAEYLKLLNQLQSAKDMAAQAMIEVERLQNLFKVECLLQGQTNAS